MSMNLSESHSEHFESYVPLVASVFYNGNGVERPRTCMLTSVRSGSGVTTTALGMSMVLAASTSESVALVNANPVSPGLDEMLDLGGMTTFADLLRGRTDAPLMTNRNRAGGIWVVPGGDAIDNRAYMLNAERVERAISKLQNTFDYVIFDAAPVSAHLSHGLVLAAKTDAVILVIESGTTRHQVLAEAKKKLERTARNVLGVVINKKQHHVPDFLYRRI